MTDRPDTDDLRDILHRVQMYREVCRHVRGTANGTLLSGVIFLAITAFLYNQIGEHPTVFVCGAIGFAELLVGVWKKVRPSPEGVLVDALLQFAFVVSVVWRQVIAVQMGLKPNPVSVLIGVWCLWDAFRTLMAYFHLRKAFPARPSAAHLRYVEELTQEVLDGDPKTNEKAADFGPLKLLFAGDVAFFAEPQSRTLFLADRDGVRAEATGTRVKLVIDGVPYPADPDAASLANFRRWKGDPVPTVKPYSGESS